MDPAELDIAIGELETRVERLRSLYEQYFLGIEKIEPQVARKDVERRVYALRRAKIRNTAKRFKLQTIIQRYNTFQQYWQRICREIERGTYRRHVLRAERGTATVSDAVTRQAKEKAASEQRGAKDAAQASSEQLADMLARDVDAEQEFARAVADAERPRRAAKPSPSQAPLGSLDLELDGIDAGADPQRRPSHAAQQPGVQQPRTAAAGGGSAAAPRPRNLLASLGRQPTKTGEGVPLAPPPRRTLTDTEPQRIVAKPAEAPAAPAAPAEPARPPPAAATPAAPKPAAVAQRAQARPEVAKAGLTDQRIAELHRQLVATKHRTNETGKVSVKGLAKSLRAAETKLKQQHKNRNIDFDVVIKNGKAVVKPIVR